MLRHIPWPWLSQIQRECLSCQSPVLSSGSLFGEGRLGCGRSGRWPAVSPIGFGGNPAGFDGRESRDGRLIMEPLEHSVLVTTVVWELLEYSDCVVTDHVDIDSFWMAPWDTGGTFGNCCRAVCGFLENWPTFVCGCSEASDGYVCSMYMWDTLEAREMIPEEFAALADVAG